MKSRFKTRESTHQDLKNRYVYSRQGLRKFTIIEIITQYNWPLQSGTVPPKAGIISKWPLLSCAHFTKPGPLFSLQNHRTQLVNIFAKTQMGPPMGMYGSRIPRENQFISRITQLFLVLSRIPNDLC